MILNQFEDLRGYDMMLDSRGKAYPILWHNFTITKWKDNIYSLINLKVNGG